MNRILRTLRAVNILAANNFMVIILKIKKILLFK